MSCQVCGISALDHPHKLIEDGNCDPNCVYVEGSSEPKNLKEVSCDECAGLKFPATLEPIATEAWGDLQARCLANCKIPGAANIGTAGQTVKNNNKNIAIVVIILLAFILISTLIYTF